MASKKRTLFDFEFSGGTVKKRKETENVPETSVPASTKPKEHKFQEQWRKKWPWLETSESDGSEARLCEYNGRYYCELCHWNDLMYIPAQILHNWDFEKRKVCRASKQFLKLMMKRAVIRVQDVNPMLFNYVEQLNDIKNLREELLVMKKYIMACPTAMKAKFLLQLSSRPHFVECSDRYSLQDLLDSDDTLIPDLVQVHSSWAQHIKTDCELCQGRGFICELCTNAEVLFPFDNIAVVCSCCSSVMHRICFAQKVMCPKCERRRKRKEQEGTSDSGGS
ncbi:hypothetical protein BaRGS_00030132 [Batillaria attramentaria]|uniref:Rubicon Homology domain-containing protein n=1 Tax=Batillaria attramentaria TaxID=370345 RepID=A0ABD0JVI3_9CAEN